jgi:hypothetical protein
VDGLGFQKMEKEEITSTEIAQNLAKMTENQKSTSQQKVNSQQEINNNKKSTSQQNNNKKILNK